MKFIPPPNYTQTPNAIFDLMPEMSECELKVVMAICRKTFGWHKDRDRLSLSQLMALTGLSKPSVIKGIDEGRERGIIDREPVADSFAYFLVVNEIDQPEVKNLDTQKKEEKEKINNNKNDALQAISPKQEAWNELRDMLMIVSPMDLERFEQLWAQFPDMRRHKFALEQTKKFANPVSSKYYETIFLRYDPERPKERDKPNGRGENLNPKAAPTMYAEAWLEMNAHEGESPQQVLDRLKVEGKVDARGIVNWRDDAKNTGRYTPVR